MLQVAGCLKTTVPVSADHSVVPSPSISADQEDAQGFTLVRSRGRGRMRNTPSTKTPRAYKDTTAALLKEASLLDVAYSQTLVCRILLPSQLVLPADVS